LKYHQQSTINESTNVFVSFDFDPSNEKPIKLKGVFRKSIK